MARTARVIGTTPKFANGIYAPTSLYDLMEEVYERESRVKMADEYDVGEVDWYRHIWPLLQRPPLLSWVNTQADGGHGKRCNLSSNVAYLCLHCHIQDLTDREIFSTKDGKTPYPIIAPRVKQFDEVFLVE